MSDGDGKKGYVSFYTIVQLDLQNLGPVDVHFPDNITACMGLWEC